jgi:GrpB-like predicted nucleotidyltransferase (UPF0157 family)
MSIVAYDPRWPSEFERLATRIKTALGGLDARVEHVGSTAVPGLAAKPIIDLDVVVARTADVQPAISLLSTMGYVHEGDLGIPGREAFRWPAGEARHHLYLLLEGASELKRHLAFRDALRANTALRDAYATLKHALAAEHGADRMAYTDGKSEFIRAALEGAASVVTHRSDRSAHRG